MEDTYHPPWGFTLTLGGPPSIPGHFGESGWTPPPIGYRRAVDTYQIYDGHRPARDRGDRRIDRLVGTQIGSAIHSVGSRMSGSSHVLEFVI